jgi:hypothetical protein
MLPAGFEPTILVSERPQTHALDSTATGIGNPCYTRSNRLRSTSFNLRLAEPILQLTLRALRYKYSCIEINIEARRMVLVS